MASPSLAGSWDNVGLLLEPSLPHTVQRMLLTNDLTPAVMKEAVDHGVNMIVSYHPPIFAPLKRVTQSSWKERIVAGCLERRIALYSPHTSWDAAVDGVNDWLIHAFVIMENVECTDVAKLPLLGYGMGRVGQLRSLITMETAVAAIKKHLNLPHVRLAQSAG
ncbi:hypothetical protein V1264_021617 [Littorina saxatilis]|uniref:NIF3-like protein 1 n=1 Tax=Littorina saxatilis TaxID=31220 RepID=A0AAN9AIJ0_9CAEN